MNRSAEIERLLGEHTAAERRRFDRIGETTVVSSRRSAAVVARARLADPDRGDRDPAGGRIRSPESLFADFAVGPADLAVASGSERPWSWLT